MATLTMPRLETVAPDPEPTESSPPVEEPTPDGGAEPTALPEEPATEPASPEQPEGTPEPEAEPDAPADEEEPPLRRYSDTLRISTNGAAFGYVTASGYVDNPLGLAVVLRVQGDGATKNFAQPFPVPVATDGTFEMTIHLPPGGHWADLWVGTEKLASATFDVV